MAEMLHGWKLKGKARILLVVYYESPSYGVAG